MATNDGKTSLPRWKSNADAEELAVPSKAITHKVDKDFLFIISLSKFMKILLAQDVNDIKDYLDTPKNRHILEFQGHRPIQKFFRL